MRYLLDTHAIIWMVEGSSKMPRAVKEIIASPVNIIGICAISIWEIAIKLDIGKLELSISLEELVELLRAKDFLFIQLEDEHLLGLSSLPMMHKDPFDRLLISTALAEEMSIITVDENIRKYDVPWVW